MSNLKERLQQIKDDYAKEQGYADFYSLLFYRHIRVNEIKTHIDEICKRYAEEVIKEASEVACDSLELYPSEYKKLEQSIIKLIEEL